MVTENESQSRTFVTLELSKTRRVKVGFLSVIIFMDLVW